MGQRSMLMGLLAILVAGCADNNYEEHLLGEWYNESVRVDIDALDGEVDSVFSVPAGKWEEILQIQPILTTYKKDGTYESIYRELDGSLLQKSSGEWMMRGDSLFLTSQGMTTGYHFEWQEGKGEFRGYLDWDSDGIADDFYSGIQIKK
ncbi:hypothetical protein [Roseivirga sp.]|uniref:hypothetical protein n=1 Tax=Roseivirga sp. TaxID=1964215 RepID=UPI003B51D20E